jgi:hypothetical protein
MTTNANMHRERPAREQDCSTLDEGFNWHRIRRLTRKA